MIELVAICGICNAERVDCFDAEDFIAWRCKECEEEFCKECTEPTIECSECLSTFCQICINLYDKVCEGCKERE